MSKYDVTEEEPLTVTQHQTSINLAIDYLGVYLGGGEVKVFDKETVKMFTKIINEDKGKYE